MIPLAVTWAATEAVVAITADAWVAIIVGIIGPTFTAFSVLFYKALAQLRRERKAAPTHDRTVAWDEMESLARMYNESLKQTRLDEQECRAELDTCRGWQRDHIKICPLFGGSRGSRR